MDNFENLVNRPIYIKQLNSWFNHTDLVKIITGIRRCGKSKLFVLFQQELIKTKKAKKSQIININLENVIETRKIGLKYNEKGFLTGFEKLIDFVISKIKTDIINYVFIDEIQLLENWQLAANTLKLQNNIDLYLTGSNAYMFSGDLANSFGGRFIEIKVQPFSFKEYYSEISKKENDIFKIYTKYITESGFPQTLQFNSDKQLIYDYLLNTVYLNTLQKDIIQRNNIPNSNKPDSVIKYIFDNIGNETSLRSIERGMKAAGHNISVPTLDTYIKSMLDSYLIYKCERYDLKGKKYLNGNIKYYVSDVGLRNVLLGSEDKDLGHILENVVYLELLRRGYKVSTGKIAVKTIKGERKEIETDFIATKNGRTEYYQVALNSLEPEILNRELTPLKEINDNYPKFLLTMDFGEGENQGIKRLNVLDWLLMD